jgi:hypothetical protein
MHVEVILGLSLRLRRREQVGVPEWISLTVCGCSRFSRCWVVFQGLGYFPASHDSCFCSRVIAGGGSPDVEFLSGYARQ